MTLLFVVLRKGGSENCTFIVQEQHRSMVTQHIRNQTLHDTVHGHEVFGCAHGCVVLGLAAALCHSFLSTSCPEQSVLVPADDLVTGTTIVVEPCAVVGGAVEIGVSECSVGLIEVSRLWLRVFGTRVQSPLCS